MMAISARPDITDDSTPSPWNGQRMTLEEFLALPEQKPALEFVDGVVTQKMAAKPVHGSLQAYLAARFNQVAWPSQLGMAFTEARFVTPDWAPVPDLVFYISGRGASDDLPVLEPPGDSPLPPDFTEPPDIAVEVKSPGQSVSDQIEKCLRYQRLGVTITLFIHPEERTVMMFRPDQPLLLLRGDDRIDLDDVLPGFEMTVRGMFQDSAPAWFRRRRNQATSQATPDNESPR